MSTTQTAIADQLAGALRSRRCCDALAPCRDCKAGRTEVQTVRALARVPQQRTAGAR